MPHVECFDAARVLGEPDPSRDLLLTAALAPEPKAVAAWRTWEQSSGKPSRVAERWLPLVGWHLRNGDLSPQSHDVLTAAQRRAWVANVRLWTAAESTLRRLDVAGIEWMLLKGAALAWTIYDSPALRPIGDVDVLVRPGDAARARALLSADGWRAAAHAEWSDTSGLHGTNYTKGRYGALDLHTFALRENCQADADAGFWQRSVTATVEGRVVRILSPADQLLHVCIHGLRWNPVHSCHWVADAARIITHAGRAMEWAGLVAEARRRDVALQAHGALDVVWRAAGSEVPDAVHEELAVPRASWRARLERHVKARPLHGPGGLLLIWYDWRRLHNARPGSTTIGFTRYLAHTMRLASRAAIIPAVARHLSKRASLR